MRYIDAFNHFFPERFFAGVLETPAAQKDMGKRIRGIPALFDIPTMVFKPLFISRTPARQDAAGAPAHALTGSAAQR